MRQKRRFVFSIVAGLALVATNAYAQAAERPVNFSIGFGWTFPNSEVADHLGSGWNFNIGLQGNITPVIALEGLYSFNGLGEKTLLIDVADTPGGPTTPREFSGDMNMQYGTASLIFQRPSGGARPYGLIGMGVYYRPIKVTTPGVGFVPGYCNPWWYYCVPGGFVEVENILGSRSSTDFGMSFGGGVNFNMIYAELRYHYIWGPTVDEDVNLPVQPIFPAPELTTDRKANGQFLQLTFGLRF